MNPMPKPTWANADDGWPYQLFTFPASVATTSTHVDFVGPIPEPGWHTHDSGFLGLAVATASVSSLLAYHVQRARRR
jgi:hypothetical protein